MMNMAAIDGISPSTDKIFKGNLIYNADILGSSNKKQADFFLWKDSAYTDAQYREWFRCRKPCIKGSDSHNINDELGKLKDHNSQPMDKYCWIKANPTFGGLRQIINEPEDRVYIGKLPPKLEELRSNPTRYIDRLHSSGSIAICLSTATWLPLSVTRAVAKAPWPIFLRLPEIRIANPGISPS
jgi:hypothetical protein